jgi:hypothetical protein
MSTPDPMPLDEILQLWHRGSLSLLEALVELLPQVTPVNVEEVMGKLPEKLQRGSLAFFARQIPHYDVMIAGELAEGRDPAPWVAWREWARRRTSLESARQATETSIEIYARAPVEVRWVEAVLREDVGAAERIREEETDRFLLFFDGLTVHFRHVSVRATFGGQPAQMRSYVRFHLVGDKYRWSDVHVFALRLLARFAALEGACVLSHNGIGIAASRGDGATVLVREDVVGDLIERADVVRSGVPHALGPVEWDPWGD